MKYDEDYDDSTTTVPQTRSIDGTGAKRTQVISQETKTQKQHIVLDPLEDLDATVHQSTGNFPKHGTILQPGELIPGSPGHRIPNGFRGKVHSFTRGKL